MELGNEIVTHAEYVNCLQFDVFSSIIQWPMDEKIRCLALIDAYLSRRG